jgi:peptidoglycan hydrolase-like protein with peptidoglycan-binding domain
MNEMNNIGFKNSIVSLLFLFILALTPFFALAQEPEPGDFPDGSLWRAEGEADVYVICSGMKRHINSPEVFYSYNFKFPDVKTADPDVLTGIPDVRVIKTPDAEAVYDITSGKKQRIKSAEEFLDDEFSWDEICMVNNTDLESYPVLNDATGQASGGTQTTDTAFDSEPLILKEIATAKQLLAEAPPLYPQEKTLVFSTGTIKKGSSGENVVSIQKKLKELGYFPKATTANGNFGPATEKAVRSFQASLGLPSVGYIGPQTLTALVKRGLAIQTGSKKVSQWKDAVPESREVLIAAHNDATQKTQLIKVSLESQKVRVGKYYRKVLKAVSRTPGFTVHYKSGSGVNVQYAVTSPEGWQVLANRFPIFDEASGTLGTFPPSEEVYVPYNDHLKTPEVVTAGREYLDNTVKQAIAELRRKGVQSVSGRGLLADLVDPDELKNIAIIEHIDHTEFAKTEDKHGVINKVMTILGTNKESAYRFSGSSKGALGLAQFMSGTYAGIQKDYPQAQLIPGFDEGMANHVNAFQAMALYHDISGASLESYVRGTLATAPADVAFVLAEVRAAAYNGGAGRVRTAIKKFGDGWDTAIGGLRAETKAYLTKFRVVRQILKTS